MTKKSLLAAVCGAAALNSTAALWAKNPVENGSFEFPEVKASTPATEGGSPDKATEPTSWLSVEDKADATGGTLKMGLTNAQARTGQQSLFVDFTKLTAQSQAAELVSKFLEAKPEQTYKMSVWVKLDEKRPLAMDERRSILWLDVDFYQEDKETEAGETEHRLYVVPGLTRPGRAPELTFTAKKWTETVVEFKAPPKTAFVQVTITVTAPKDEGETDGVLYIDDVAIEETSAAAAVATPGATPAR